MDTNYVRKDGFSNPDTERYFAQNWDEERMIAEAAAHKNCDFCAYNYVVIGSPEEREWRLCLNEKSRYCHETVSWAFSCPDQEPEEGAEEELCHWEPPRLPPTDRRNGFDLGFNDEHE